MAMENLRWCRRGHNEPLTLELRMLICHDCPFDRVFAMAPEWTSDRVDDHCFLPLRTDLLGRGRGGYSDTLTLSTLTADRVTDCMPYPISSRSTAIRGGMELALAHCKYVDIFLTTMARKKLVLEYRHRHTW